MLSSSSLLLLHNNQGLSHFQSLLPFTPFRLKPHKLSLRVAIAQRFNEPNLNTSIAARKLNAARFPNFQCLFQPSAGLNSNAFRQFYVHILLQIVEKDFPMEALTSTTSQKFFKNLLISKDIEAMKTPLLCFSTFSIGQAFWFISEPTAHASDKINANAIYDVGELFELGIQLSYLLLLLGFLGVGTFFVIRQVLVRRELDLSAKELQEQVRSGDASATEYFELGAVMLRRKFYPAAFKYLLQAIEKWDGDDQDLAQVYNALGVSYMLDDKLDKGITQFEMAVKLQPGYVTAWNNLGDAYEKKKEFKSALKAFEEVLLFDPNNKVARPRRDALKEKVEMLRGVPVKSKER